jgi:hypothetical protein
MKKLTILLAIILITSCSKSVDPIPVIGLTATVDRIIFGGPAVNDNRWATTIHITPKVPVWINVLLIFDEPGTGKKGVTTTYNIPPNADVIQDFSYKCSVAGNAINVRLERATTSEGIYNIQYK